MQKQRQPTQNYPLLEFFALLYKIDQRNKQKNLTKKEEDTESLCNLPQSDVVDGKNRPSTHTSGKIQETIDRRHPIITAGDIS